MNLNEYGDFVEERWTGGKKGRLTLQDLYVMSVGLPGETGEVCEILKKSQRDGTLDREHLRKELGDVLYYLIRIAKAYEIEPQSILDTNVEKINGRHERGTLHGSGDNR